MASLVCSTEDIASVKISEKLMERLKGKLSECKDGTKSPYEFLETDRLVFNDSFSCSHEFMIAPSRHASVSGFPCFTAHVPGNPEKADYGGKPRTLNIGYGSLVRAIIGELHALAKDSAPEMQVVLEQDHHGPTIQKPIVFVEIGSSEKEWITEKYSDIVSSAIANVLDRGIANCRTAQIAIGNTHYPKKFTDLLLDESQEYCFSHVFSKYAAEQLDEDMLKQAMERSMEKVKAAVIDWKSLKGGVRNRIIEVCNGIGLEVIRV